MDNSSNGSKRKRGRPRKNAGGGDSAPKRGRGRPRKNANGEPPAMKRKRGRPPKDSSIKDLSEAITAPLRKRGRPPKLALDFAAGREDKRRSAASFLLDRNDAPAKPVNPPVDEQLIAKSDSAPVEDSPFGELDAEFAAFLEFLPSVFERIRNRIERQVEIIREELHDRASDDADDDKAIAKIEKLADRLAAFRAEGTHSAADLARLAKRLDRAQRRLRRDS